MLNASPPPIVAYPAPTTPAIPAILQHASLHWLISFHPFPSLYFLLGATAFTHPSISQSSDSEVLWRHQHNHYRLLRLAWFMTSIDFWLTISQAFKVSVSAFRVLWIFFSTLLASGLTFGPQGLGGVILKIICPLTEEQLIDIVGYEFITFPEWVVKTYMRWGVSVEYLGHVLIADKLAGNIQSICTYVQTYVRLYA